MLRCVCLSKMKQWSFDSSRIGMCFFSSPLNVFYLNELIYFSQQLHEVGPVLNYILQISVRKKKNSPFPPLVLLASQIVKSMRQIDKRNSNSTLWAQKPYIYERVRDPACMRDCKTERKSVVYTLF